MGPAGRRIAHFQAPENLDPTTTDPTLVNIDPTLHNLAATPPPPAVEPPATTLPLVTPTAAPPIASQVQTPRQAPRPSMFGSSKLDDAIRKAATAIKPVSQKRSIEESFLEMQKYEHHLVFFI